MKKATPTGPLCTGRGETDARIRFNVTVQRVLPLCKGELEGVVGKVKDKSRKSRNVGPVRLESKIITFLSQPA